ncbi:AMP-dependent synthetase and ligase family protein [Artemisia annua]|uniref:AMP-dependent synthetase and ligase family protein n=1 Tax=Artemisia annua TaxID=35608 RepID=A0A2U1NRW9_ARTAN|nr:AMP-dependent synthetase and ligase family protein [Artemisia annua]
MEDDWHLQDHWSKMDIELNLRPTLCYPDLQEEATDQLREQDSVMEYNELSSLHVLPRGEDHQAEDKTHLPSISVSLSYKRQYLFSTKAYKRGKRLTETCAGSFVSIPNEIGMLGTVGPPVPALDARSESVPEMNYDACSGTPRGEVCIRGDVLFSGY